MSTPATRRATPGVYPGPGQATLLRANQQAYLFQQQLVTAGQASIAVQLERINRQNYPFACSLQIWFTDVNGVAADPGTIDIEAQGSDVDVAAQYSNELGLTGGINAGFSGRIELATNWFKFLRVLATTITNSVYLNALVSR